MTKETMYSIVLSVTIGCTLGNFLYQAFKKESDWGSALERSFFQLATSIAICLAVLLN